MDFFWKPGKQKSLVKAEALLNCMEMIRYPGIVGVITNQSTERLATPEPLSQ